MPNFNKVTIKHSNTIGSLEVAEMVEKEHKHLIRDIRNYCDILAESKIGPGEFFLESTYIDKQNQERPCYELTKKGCDMVANKMTGSKGVIFTAKYVTRFEEMEQSVKRVPVSMEEIMIYQLEEQQKLKQQVNQVNNHMLETKNRVAELEDNIHITRSQQKQLRSFANEVVVKTLGSKHSQAYKELKQKAFSEFWKSYQNAFNIASYLDTPKKDFQIALNFINSWTPNRDLALMIKGANIQLEMEC